MTDETTFPSPTWFDQMVADTGARPDLYRRLGFADFRLVLKVLDDGRARSYGLSFDGYDVSFEGELDDLDAFGADATLEGDLETWQEMIRNILRNGRADSAHTLNALTIAETPLKVSSPDPLGRDKFFRYAETLQTLFDSLGHQLMVS